MKVCLVPLVFCALLAASLAAQDEVPPGVRIRAAADPQKATVGDPIRIDFELDLPREYQVRFPSVGNQLRDFAVLEVYPGPKVPDARPEPSGTKAQPEVKYRARIVAALYKVGEFEFPPLPLVLRDAGGKEHALSTPAIKIQIQSVLTDKDQDLKDLKNQAEIHEAVRWILWLALALLLALLAALAWWRWQRGRRAPELRLPAPPQMDPLSLAEAELRDLLALRLIENGFVKQFYVSLSEIAKKILEAGYGIQTVEKTSREILESLRNGGRVASTENLRHIEDLLLAYDLVKFAKYVPPGPENEAAVKNTVQILEVCKKQRETPPSVPVAIKSASQTARPEGL